jgi:hypothetical protein
MITYITSMITPPSSCIPGDERVPGDAVPGGRSNTLSKSAGWRHLKYISARAVVVNDSEESPRAESCAWKMERTGSAATGVGQEDDVEVKAGSVPRWSECAAAT